MLDPLTPEVLAERRRRGLSLLQRARSGSSPRATVSGTFGVDLLAPSLAEHGA